MSVATPTRPRQTNILSITRTPVFVQRSATGKDHNVKTGLVLRVQNTQSTRNKTDRIRDAIF